MEIREAILRAADSIEANPDRFHFMGTSTPDGCGSPGCALGWIGHHLGMRGFFDVAADALGLSVGERPWRGDFPAYEFYRRMDMLERGRFFDSKWKADASVCAKTLRLYADKYHPAVPKTEHRVPNKGIPDNVLSIFREGIAA